LFHYAISDASAVGFHQPFHAHVPATVLFAHIAVREGDDMLLQQRLKSLLSAIFSIHSFRGRAATQSRSQRRVLNRAERQQPLTDERSRIRPSSPAAERRHFATAAAAA